jgi:Phage tail tube protein
MALARVFGVKDDAVTGGSEYDDLVAGAVPDATIFWPITGGTFDMNIERLDRNDEIRGRRANTPPIAFRSSPMMTVPMAAYASILGKALKKTLGGADTVTGAMAPYTHGFGILAYGALTLPCVMGQIVRDDLNQKMSGGSFNRLSLSFPLDGEGTMEMEIWGLFADQFGTAAPTPSFSGISEDPMILRDAQVFIDGSMTAVPDLQGFDFSFVNNLERKFYAKRDVVSKSLGSPAKVKRLWFPAENKLGAAQDVTYRIQLGNVSTAQELAMNFGQVQKFVFEIEGSSLVSGGKELLRITIYGGAHTGGGAEGLTRTADITAGFDGGAFFSEADNADVKIELVNDTSTPYT